ncbi:transcription initiation factor TFIID subunit 4 [Eucyclogobius newberryi]|uniref:transcription initiation factor TFIID subunit 4 n=1 Tax=Eucyclogobius newberryi TaxID=166745 RepID=UPI003B5A58F1
MDAPKSSTDSSGHDPGTPLVSGGVTSLPAPQGKVDSLSVQTLNGSQSMNSHNSGSAVPLQGTSGSGPSGSSNSTSVSSGPLLSKGLPTSNSVIQTSPINSQTHAGTQVAGATVTLVRPPMHIVALNGNNNGSPAAVTATGISLHPPLVNNSPDPSAVSVSTGSNVIKQEPIATIIQSPPQQAVSPRTPVSLSASPGGVRALTPQMLAPRLPQPTPGQPSVHNIQLPAGMVLVRSESGQLLMIPQQALAQMQAQAQGGLAPRAATPTNIQTPGQTPGNAVISRPVAPSTVLRPGGPATTTLPKTTTLHRPPILQSAVGSAMPGMTPRPTGTTVTPHTYSKETMENVNKCKNFLSTLIKLASTGKQSTETAVCVRQLVKDLLEGRLEAEEFTSRLYKELNSSPQPYLVPFLKRSLPALRQLTPDSTAFIQQGQLPQSSSGPAATTSTVILSSPGPRVTTTITRPLLQPSVTKPGQSPSLVLQTHQQRTIVRPQVTLPTASMVTFRNHVPSRIMLGQQQVHLKELQPALTLAQRNKLKEAGGTFKDDDDINDVASMAGVNLTEESANILATNSSLVGSVTHSCEDEAFLSCALLQRRMLEIGKRHGVTDFGTDVVKLVSHATQQHLQTLMEKVTQVAQQKNINLKDDNNFEQSSDVRAQLKFFEQLDQLEKQRKEEQEREILLKAAKSRARQEDPEQLRLKQKAKEMQQQELAQMRQREANLTALAAIGPRKKRKIGDLSSSSSVSEGSGTGSSVSGGASASGSRPTRQRTTRVNLRDLLFCLENERFTSHSHFLYKGFLK